MANQVAFRNHTTICLIGDPGNVEKYQGDRHFSDRLARALKGFPVYFIGPKEKFIGMKIDYEFIDINDRDTATARIKQAALILKCPLLRADLPEVYRPILAEKEQEGRFLTIQEYCIDTYYASEAEAQKENGELKKADLRTGPGRGRLGIFIPSPIEKAAFKDLSPQLQALLAGYTEKALQGFGYGHTYSLALFPWLISQVLDQKGNDPALIVLILGKGEKLTVDDLQKKLCEMHAGEGTVVLITEKGRATLSESQDSKRRPLHIFLLSVPIPYEDVQILQTISAENDALFHLTGDQTVSDWASLQKSPRFVYELMNHKQQFHDALQAASEESTGNSLISSVLSQYFWAKIDFSNHLTHWEINVQKLTPASKAKERLCCSVIPLLKEEKATTLYRAFSSHLKEHYDLAKNIRAFVEQQGIEPIEIAEEEEKREEVVPSDFSPSRLMELAHACSMM